MGFPNAAWTHALRNSRRRTHQPIRAPKVGPELRHDVRTSARLPRGVRHRSCVCAPSAIVFTPAWPFYKRISSAHPPTVEDEGALHRKERWSTNNRAAAERPPRGPRRKIGDLWQSRRASMAKFPPKPMQHLLNTCAQSNLGHQYSDNLWTAVSLGTNTLTNGSTRYYRAVRCRRCATQTPASLDTRLRKRHAAHPTAVPPAACGGATLPTFASAKLANRLPVDSASCKLT